MAKIGIYGGTFDPIHYAHLILARDAYELFQFEKVIFLPAAASPDRTAPVAPAETRLEMVQAAIDRAIGLEADDCELRRPPPSYTIDTVEVMARRYSNDQLFFLIGDDNLPSLPRWKRFPELQQMVNFVVLRRAEKPIEHQYLRVERRIDISATEIRTRIAARRPVHFLLPPAVEEIIRRQGLYQEART